MPEENREVMALHASGYEYREIADMLDITVSTVGSHVSSWEGIPCASSSFFLPR